MFEPRVADAPPLFRRVARRPRVTAFSEITAEDAQLQGGNRFDVPGGGVLYGATELRACYAEVLEHLRPSPEMQDRIGNERGYMVIGSVPADWRHQRVKSELMLVDALPFLDLEQPETHAFLSRTLSADLVALGYEGSNLDFSDICNRDRQLSRRIAEWAYTAHDEAGDALYSGIKYRSRINASWDCWAVFEGSEVYAETSESIELTDPDLEAVGQMWGLHLR